MSPSTLTHACERPAAFAAAFAPLRAVSAPALPSVGPLSSADAAEALAFLAARPLHTVNMAGLIRDNGVVSTLNRGTFHACRDEAGRLEGVALVGHAILFESRTERATAAFARLARRRAGAHLILGEEGPVKLFWRHYAEGGQEPRRLCRELLLEQRWPVEAHAPVAGLRAAARDDLEEVVNVQAGLVLDESGVDPLESDPQGFRERCAWRVGRRRTWVVTDGGRLMFKAEVYAETPRVTYLEGVYVAPERRGGGYGLRCLSQLTRNLLRRSDSVCLLVNEQNAAARAFYQRAGYRQRAVYDTIFFRK
ncbi:MAG TPA: GNAT family N-acetyltransferase [Pyrinomonadaceae bacterium]|nr:GNAT family N-acetyltransferase [Pyrinomonadaceae bacterium]